MKRRHTTWSTMMVCLVIVSADAFNRNSTSPLVEEDEVFREAYYDSIHILSTANECSDFFGGSATSVEAFNNLFARADREFLTPSIGLKMSGVTTNVVNITTGRKHRLFDKVTINRNGPFYRYRVSQTQPTVPGVGSYPPNTREARVLMLLHELGHAVEVNGAWLLPDDGGDAELSRSNTRKVEDVCKRQIRSVWKREATVIPPQVKVESQ